MWWSPALVVDLSISHCRSVRVFGVFFFEFFNLFFWLHQVFIAAHRLSLVAASRGYSLRWLLLLPSIGFRRAGFRRAGFSSCGSRALECRLSSCGAQA